MANISAHHLLVRVDITADRYGHTTTAIGPHLLIFGGWELNKAQNEVIVLRDCESVIPTEQMSKEGSKEQLLGGQNIEANP